MKKKYLNLITKEFLEKEYIQNKYSSVFIAKMINVSVDTIWRRLKEFNIPIRSISESQKLVQGGIKNGMYIDGRSSKQYYCKNCSVSISKASGLYGKGYCQKCWRLFINYKRSGNHKKRTSIKGKNNSAYIDGRTLEKHYCKICKINEVSYPTFLYGKGMCQQCYFNYLKIPEHNGNWKNGKTNLKQFILRLNEYKIWRTEIFKRDNYTCKECFQYGNKLNAHHIKPFSLLLQEFLQIYNQFSPLEDREILVRLAISYEPFWDLINGKTLCDKCHKKTDSFLKHESRK